MDSHGIFMLSETCSSFHNLVNSQWFMWRKNSMYRCTRGRLRGVWCAVMVQCAKLSDNASSTEQKRVIFVEKNFLVITVMMQSPSCAAWKWKREAWASDNPMNPMYTVDKRRKADWVIGKDYNKNINNVNKRLISWSGYPRNLFHHCAFIRGMPSLWTRT